jgi:hypothetical protein
MANRSVAHHPLVPGFSWIWVHGHRWDTLGRGTEFQGSVTVQTSQRPLHAPVRRNSDLATRRHQPHVCQPRKRANSMTPEAFGQGAFNDDKSGKKSLRKMGLAWTGR